MTFLKTIESNYLFLSITLPMFVPFGETKSFQVQIHGPTRLMDSKKEREMSLILVGQLKHLDQRSPTHIPYDLSPNFQNFLFAFWCWLWRSTITTADGIH